MRPTENIKKLIKNAKINLDPASKKAGLAHLIDELQKSKTPDFRPANETLNIWSIIMKSKITKLATAAIILLAAILIINHFNGSIDGSSVAWAQVVQQLKSHEKYKCRQRVVREEGIQIPTMNIYHMNLSLRRQKAEDGTVQIIDMRGEDAVTLELYPDKKKAIVTKLIGFGPKKDPDIIEMAKQFEQDSTEKLGTKKQNGMTLCGFRYKANKYNDFTIWVDAKTKLPVEIKLVHFRNDQVFQTIFMDEFEFDFQLDPSAFSTEVPQGYKIENLTHDYNGIKSKIINIEDISLNHALYTVDKLPWMQQIITIEADDPLGVKTNVYITGIKSDDGNVILIVQGNYYDISKMVWIHQQQPELQINNAKLYPHPKGSIYAQCFLKKFKEIKPEFFENKKLSKERFTKMAVMPDDPAVLGISANKQMSDEKLKELVESLRKIKTN